jgi:hypothetical protein
MGILISGEPLFKLGDYGWGITATVYAFPASHGRDAVTIM